MLLLDNLPCVAGLEIGASVRVELRALTGILPDTYRAAPPRPAFAGGSLLAIIEVERGMIVVSSSYSTCLSGLICTRESGNAVVAIATRRTLTFICIFVVYGKFEVSTISKMIDTDDLPLQLKYRDAGPIECHSRGLLLGLELEKHRRRHSDRMRTTKACDFEGTSGS